MRKRIGIIFGGNSVEHEISILSFIQISHAINREQYEILPIYLTKTGSFWVGPHFDELKTFQKAKFKHYEVVFYQKNKQLRLGGLKYLPRRYRKPIDVILPVVHGRNVEDGSLAGYFRILNATYASCDVLPAAILQSKIHTKKMLEFVGIPTIPYHAITNSAYMEDSSNILQTCECLAYPMIVKPVSLGSSIGIKIATNRDELEKAIIYAFKYDEQIIVESKLDDFQEFNQAVLETDGSYILSEIEEVKTENSFLTFADKYLPATSSRTIPAEISESLAGLINETSMMVADHFKIRGISRIDYLYDRKSDTLYVNEINSIPGSLAFYLFEDKISFTDLIDLLIKAAIRAKYRDDLKINSFQSLVLSSTRLLKK